MWGLRQQASLLLDHGHTHALHYPVGRVWEEAEIVVQRVNQEKASDTSLMRVAVGAVISKEGAKLLDKVLKELTHGQ